MCSAGVRLLLALPEPLVAWSIPIMKVLQSPTAPDLYSPRSRYLKMPSPVGEFRSTRATQNSPI